jgi:hypothetical protein
MISVVREILGVMKAVSLCRFSYTPYKKYGKKKVKNDVNYFQKTACKPFRRARRHGPNAETVPKKG